MVLSLRNVTMVPYKLHNGILKTKERMWLAEAFAVKGKLLKLIYFWRQPSMTRRYTYTLTRMENWL
jgi:hypothetical protein